MPFISNPKPTTFRDSPKQREIMGHVLAAADRGEYLNLKELNHRITWGPVTPASLSMSIRHLEAHGFLTRLYAWEKETDVAKMTVDTGDQEKIRGMKMHIVPKPFAYNYFRPGS